HIRSHEAAGVVAVAVDAVRVRCKREDAGRSGELEREPREVLEIASAAAVGVTEHDARLAAGQDRGRRPGARKLERKPRVLPAERLGLAVEIVALPITAYPESI